MRLLFALIIGTCAVARRISSANQHQIDLLKMFSNHTNLNNLTNFPPFPSPINTVVPPKNQQKFKTVEHQVDFLNHLTKIEKPVQTRINQSTVPESKIRLDKYYRYSEIQDYLNDLFQRYENWVTLRNYGKSYEERNLTLIYISSTNDQTNKPIIFVDAGMHGREWIGPAQALYIIHQIIERPENFHLLQNVDWVVIPLVNPDGYEYSHTTNRAWRKTRSKGKLCNGVDPNRNFGHHWNGPGSLNFECSLRYAGPFAFSERETLALSQAIEAYADRAKLYLTFHSFAQAFLYPWGYTADPPENEYELHNLASVAARGVSVRNGTQYKIGSSFTTLRPASGSSRDWAYAVAGIKLAYTVELPPGGERGFDLPPEDILGVVEEMFVGIRIFHKYIEEKYGGVEMLHS